MRYEITYRGLYQIAGRGTKIDKQEHLKQEKGNTGGRYKIRNGKTQTTLGHIPAL